MDHSASRLVSLCSFHISFCPLCVHLVTPSGPWPCAQACSVIHQCAFTLSPFWSIPEHEVTQWSRSFSTLYVRKRWRYSKYKLKPNNTSVTNDIIFVLFVSGAAGGPAPSSQLLSLSTTPLHPCIRPPWRSPNPKQPGAFSARKPQHNVSLLRLLEPPNWTEPQSQGGGGGSEKGWGGGHRNLKCYFYL